MILIADSGATKTDWLVSGSQEVINTVGINPYFVSEVEIKNILRDSDLNKISDKIKGIYFYGSGCGSDEGRIKIQKALKDVFINSHVDVETDLMGAYRSLFPDDDGIAVILGTGSNSAHFINGRIESNFPSLGYILGDEGSGSYLGKKFLNKILSGMMTEKLRKSFEIKFGLSVQEILSRVYSGPYPNRYLASFTPFILENIRIASVYELVYESLEDFFKANLLRYKNVEGSKIRFTGSVSYYFRGIIKDLGENYNLNIDRIEKSPLKGLKQYHIK